MEMNDKIERLMEKANVTRAEAEAALEQTGGDLLDAIIYLERQGKVNGSAHSSFSTEYDQQAEYVRVKDKVEEQENSAPSFKKSFQRLFRALIRFIRSTSFRVNKGEENLISMPTLVFVLLLFFFWEFVAPAMIIALFFGIRYSFDGEEGAETANHILSRAGDFAQDVKNEFVQNDKETPDGE